MRGSFPSKTFRKLRLALVLVCLSYVTFLVVKSSKRLSMKIRKAATITEDRNDLSRYVHTHIEYMANLTENDKESDTIFDIMQAAGNKLNTDMRHNSDFLGYLNETDSSVLQDELFNKHEYRFSINNKRACAQEHIILLTLVHTSPWNIERRNRIRETWGAFRRTDVAIVGPLFLLGQLDRSNSNITYADLEREAESFNDIIQGNFVDSYKNLTYKNIMGLHWSRLFCNHALFTLKTDDDALVDVSNLSDFLIQLTIWDEYTDFLYCTPILDPVPMRNRSEKWFISKDDYPFDTYPPYCQGYAYVMSNDVTQKLYDATRDVKYFWIDDLLVTGFLATKTGISKTNVRKEHRFGFLKKDMHVDEYTFLVAFNETGFEHWYSTWKAIGLKRAKTYLKEILHSSGT